jgi:prolipoprotein diacylglyceryltransferase
MLSRGEPPYDRECDTAGVGKPTLAGRYTSATVPIAVIAFDFDPLLQIGQTLTVRWQTVALAVTVAVCLATAGVLARRHGLRADDLLFIAVGAAPGAIVGGRIGYLLTVPEAFRESPLALLDPAVGGLELGLAVVGGVISASIVAVMLGAPVGRWAHVVTLPLLAALAAGKLTMVLGGSGQGRPFDGDWATAFLPPGPWVSLAPAIPSHPSQVYEAIGTALVALLILMASSLDAFRAEDARRLLVALAGWGVVRALASVTWRDPALVGEIPMGGLIAIAITVGALTGVVLLTLRRPRRQGAAPDSAQPSWPDPETRPRF